MKGSRETPCPFYLARGCCEYLPHSSRLMHNERHKQGLSRGEPADKTCTRTGHPEAETAEPRGGPRHLGCSQSFGRSLAFLSPV